MAERPANAGLSFSTTRAKAVEISPWSSFGQVDPNGTITAALGVSIGETA